MKIGKSPSKDKLILILSMTIFGTIGIFRKQIPLSSGLIAISRGILGMIFLILLVFIKGSKISTRDIKNKLLLLLISGVFLGANWILLFESYQYTSVATSTLCYYMAPIFVIIVSPVFFKENLTIKKILCVIAALFGMVLVSGIISEGFSGIGEIKGILLGLGAAAFYTGVIVMNKKIKGISVYDKTVVQLGAAAFTLLPYSFLTEEVFDITFTPKILILLLVVGVLHTGIAYALYFMSMERLKAQTVALYSYIDPVVAILLSVFLLQEKMGVENIVGAILIFFAIIINEI